MAPQIMSSNQSVNDFQKITTSKKHNFVRGSGALSKSLTIDL